MIEIDRKAGYLAALTNVPPLIFRFQFNPEAITDKKSFNYEAANGFGQWGFDQTSAASGFFGTLGGLYKDVKEIGALLVATKPLEAREGGDRVINLDFVLDARVAGPKDGDAHYGGSIAPDLAILRSFMYPSWDIMDVSSLLLSGFRSAPCWNRPPECSLKYGGISTTCVMTDLGVKIVAFLPDGSPSRAEVSVTLKAQTFSVSPIIEFAERFYLDIRGLVREGIGQDMLEVSGLQTLIDLFK